MGRYFDGNNSDALIIENWWPDDLAFFDYIEVGYKVTLTHNTAQENNLGITGGLLTFNRLGNHSWQYGVAVAMNKRSGPIETLSHNEDTDAVGAHGSTNTGAFLTQGAPYEYTSIVYKDTSNPNYAFHGEGSVTAISETISDAGGSTAYGLPWHFFFTSAANHLVINTGTTFYGWISSIECWIEYADGTRWEKSRIFTGGAEDAIDAFVPVVLSPANSSKYTFFDTRRKLFAPIVLTYDVNSPYSYFDTRRKTTHVQKFVEGDIDNYTVFDTRRILAKRLTTLGTFDTRRRLCKRLTSYHDTRRRFIIASIVIPIDTLR